MPTADDIDNQIQDEGEHEPSAPAPAPATNVDEGKLAAGIVEGLRAYQLERDAAARAQQQQNMPATEEKELIINDDDPPSMIAQKATYNAELRANKRMAAMQHQFQTVGMGTLSQVSRRQVLDNDPIYKRFKAEVDTEISRLDPVAQANPDVLATVRDVVKSRHTDELIKEEAQKLVAAALKAGEGAAPGGSSGRNYRQRQVGEGIPSPEDLGFDEDQIAMINRRGGPDQFAMKMSAGRYSNWDDYAKAELKARAARKANKSDHKGAAIPFRRYGDKRS